MTVSDALAGRTLKCPACGDPVDVGGAVPVAAPGKKASAPRKTARPAGSSPRFYLSQGQIVALCSLLVLGLITLIIYLGPVRAWNQWDSIRGQASDDVSDVITFGLQAYLSQNGDYDPRMSHNTPSVDGGVHFFWPALVMSMPDKLHFLGLTTQGPFEGYYHPATGEIEADVSYGGRTFAGMVALAKPVAKFHMTGRMKDGHPQAEVNGTPLTIYTPPGNDSGQ